MKKINILLLFFALTFMACNGGTEETPDNVLETENTTDETTTETENTETTDEPVQEENTFVAKFVDFEFGDAAHFMFEDENGEVWDFANSMVTNFTFEQETEDGGFAGNPELLGKKFKIKYEEKEQPEYPDGPMAKVKIIVGAELLE